MIPVKRKFAGGVKEGLTQGVKSEKRAQVKAHVPHVFCIIISGIYQKKHDPANYLLSQVGVYAKLPYQTYTYV